MKKYIFLITLFFLVIILSACKSGDTTQGKINNISYKETEEITNYVKIETTKNKIILIELYPKIAPITVGNFQKLVDNKFYDGVIFHRVINNFMIQTGDPTGTGLGGSDEKITGEFASNGIKNNLSHERGVISMARSSDKNSASSQFFICQKDSTYLDGDYAAFGRVIAGMDVVDSIAKVDTDNNDKPINVQKIRSIRFVEVTK